MYEGFRMLNSNVRFVLAALAAVLTSKCPADEPMPGRVEDVSFKATSDGTEQKYVVIYPKSFDEQKPQSLLIALHGHGSDRWQFVKQARGECKAARDLATEHRMLFVSPDYRAKTSWMGPKAEADLVQIIESLKKRLKVERVIVCGGSMGGTGALTFAALHPELVDGVVSLNGTANLVEYEKFSDAIARSFGGSKKEVPDEYRRRSAEFYPERFKMPLAATTGGKDTVVPPDSVLRLLAAVRKKNRHVLSLHRKDGGHSTDYEDSKAALEFVVSRSTRAESGTRPK